MITQFVQSDGTKVPSRVHSVDELCASIKLVDNMKSVAVIIEDDNGIWIMTIDGTTAERLNWLLDRAKFTVHRAI